MLSRSFEEGKPIFAKTGRKINSSIFFKNLRQLDAFLTGPLHIRITSSGQPKAD